MARQRFGPSPLKNKTKQKKEESEENEKGNRKQLDVANITITFKLVINTHIIRISHSPFTISL